ncbi:MAG TPA: hypothetical protein VMF90_05305 [Rhizobiaceae bacterium]|nr:hypothetical protein [Rhizobiaceae bacterium]
MAKPLCPSAPLKPGASVFGYVGEDGAVAYLGAPAKVTRDFIDMAGQVERKATARLRIAAPCVKNACRHWEDRCMISDFVAASDAAARLGYPGVPDCAIREACRWFGQNGFEACRNCRFIITDEE